MGFCGACGTELDSSPAAIPSSSNPKRRLPVPLWLIGSTVAAVAIVAIGIIAFLVFGGDEGGGDDIIDSGLTFAEPATLGDTAKANLAAALNALPEPTGDTDAEQLHSVLGPPDVFQLWFEPVNGGGAATRSETWYYLDLEVSYEFRNGGLLFTIPMDDIGALLLVPLRYDPLAFDTTTTLADVRAMLDDPNALLPGETPLEYGLDVTVWAGEQLMAAFDASDELLYVETVAIDIGGGK